ncbi:hypothetical protein D3C81_2167630 [compost metagenome]
MTTRKNEIVPYLPLLNFKHDIELVGRIMLRRNYCDFTALHNLPIFNLAVILYANDLIALTKKLL